MLKTVHGALATFFGPSRNDRYALLLKQVSAMAIECARHLRATQGQDTTGIIDFERRADRIVDEIHEMLDNSFIMRFDIPDMMRLTDELDDVIDGMRKVALHVDAYQPFLTQMRPDALQLMELLGEMIVLVDTLVAMLAEPKLKLAQVRDVANRIDEMESRADRIVSDHERKLVTEFAAADAPTLGFIAWHQLLHLLEDATDNANHCASLMLSLARKEA